MESCKVTFLPSGISLQVSEGTTILQAQIAAGLHPDAPCGGKGTCGKCRVLVDGQSVAACQTEIKTDLTVTLPEVQNANVLATESKCCWTADGDVPYVAAFDIGTTTLVGFLLDGRTGETLATASAMNPQIAYGADVIARIQAVTERKADLQSCILPTLGDMLENLSAEAGIRRENISRITLVGNTAMHHLLLGVDPSPLVIPPYMPRQTCAMEFPAAGLLPIHPEGVVRVLPNIAGFVGADTVGCLVAARFGELDALTLMIDIGTNGEMVLGDKHRRIACSTAAGPAFEGAKISQGMRGCPGAIDHVTLENGIICCHVLGGGEAMGLCGSGLLDLVACLLDAGLLEESGYLPGKSYTIPGTSVALTQGDVREVQLAKAAIRAGIALMCEHLGVAPRDIRRVLLAGAFGNYLNPASACRIGMIPPVLEGRITPIGNAAGEGAKACTLSRAAFAESQRLAAETEFLELASKPAFQDRFVDALEFEEETL